MRKWKKRKGNENRRSKAHGTKLGNGKSNVRKGSKVLKKRSQWRRGRCRVRGNAWRGGVTRALQAQQLRVGAGEERERGRMYTYNKGLILSQICSSWQKKHMLLQPLRMTTCISEMQPI